VTDIIRNGRAATRLKRTGESIRLKRRETAIRVPRAQITGAHEYNSPQYSSWVGALAL